MQNQYWLIRRNSGFYSHDTRTGKRTSLKTKNRAEAQRLLAALNESVQGPLLNLQLGKIYLAAHDPKLPQRTWAEVMVELASHGKKQSQDRCRRELAAKRYDLLRRRKIVETTADDFREVLKQGGSATNNYLRRLQNLAIGLGWLAWPVIPAKLWPKAVPKAKRGITLEEYNKILESEKCEERRCYYQMLWETGAAQSDAAKFSSDNVDWNTQTLTYTRAKTGQNAYLRIGQRLRDLLAKLPQTGPLFPKLAQQKDSDRSAEFSRRCRLLGLAGISLHSFRYAWAERAVTAGYPERFALSALGHKSRAVHHIYMKNAKAICPPLEEFENKVIPYPVNVIQEAQCK